jgi:dihydropyrimidinase
VATNPAKILNLFPKKGAIAPGADADLCVIDPKLTKTLPTSPAYSASDFEVYEGFEITGWPRFTIARGEVAYAEGQIQREPGQGRVVLRSAADSCGAAGIEPVRTTA